jgi:prepilin-type processing-associated H-X9-DG protein
MTGENDAEQQAEPTPKHRTSGCVWGVVALFVIVVALMLSTPSSPIRGRDPCSKNLHNIAIAMLNYETKYHRFPPAYTVDKQGRRMHSWRALLLEFLDDDLYAQYDFSRPWNSTANLAVAQKMKKNGPYRCPAEEPKELSWTSYVMLVGPTAFSNGPTGRKLEEITEADGTTNTAAVVEMSPSGILWTAPYDLNMAEMSFRINDPDHASPRSCHSNGINIAFADGSVQFVSPDEQYLKAITTINGGEDMSKFEQN